PFQLAVEIGLRLSTLGGPSEPESRSRPTAERVRDSSDSNSFRVVRGFRAEALSLSHLTWDTTRTINLHIFGSTSFPVYGQNIIARLRRSNGAFVSGFAEAKEASPCPPRFAGPERSARH